MSVPRPHPRVRLRRAGFGVASWEEGQVVGYLDRADELSFVVRFPTGVMIVGAEEVEPVESEPQQPVTGPTEGGGS